MTHNWKINKQNFFLFAKQKFPARQTTSGIQAQIRKIRTAVRIWVFTDRLLTNQKWAQKVFEARFEVKISLKIFIFFFQFAWFTTDTEFLCRSYVWEFSKQELEEYFWIFLIDHARRVLLYFLTYFKRYACLVAWSHK
jgi:hypothetical protein